MNINELSLNRYGVLFSELNEKLQDEVAKDTRENNDRSSFKGGEPAKFIKKSDLNLDDVPF